MHRIAPTDTMVLQKPTQLDENDQHTDAGQAARKPLHERLDFRTSMARTNGRHPQFGPPWGGGGQTKPWLGFSLGGCWSLMAPAPSPGPSSRPQPQGVLEPQCPGPGPNHTESGVSVHPPHATMHMHLLMYGTMLRAHNCLQTEHGPHVVCLFVCLLACLLACLFVCLLVSGLMLLLTFICSTTRLLVCLFMFRSALLVVDSERLHVIFIEWTLRKSSLVTLMRRLHVMHAQQMPQMDKPLCRVGTLAL